MVGLKRGDLVIVSLTGDYGKPRPAVIIQSDNLKDIDSVLLCLITSNVQSPVFRLILEPDLENGLQKVFQVMTDKIFTVKREKVSKKIGEITAAQRRKLNSCLMVVLGVRLKEKSRSVYKSLTMFNDNCIVLCRYDRAFLKMFVI